MYQVAFYLGLPGMGVSGKTTMSAEEYTQRGGVIPPQLARTVMGF